MGPFAFDNCCVEFKSILLREMFGIFSVLSRLRFSWDLIGTCAFGRKGLASTETASQCATKPVGLCVHSLLKIYIVQYYIRTCTYTHAHMRTLTDPHTCSEQALRILMWNVSYVQKNTPIKPDRNWLMTRGEKQCQGILSTSLLDATHPSEPRRSLS